MRDDLPPDRPPQDDDEPRNERPNEPWSDQLPAAFVPDEIYDSLPDTPTIPLPRVVIESASESGGIENTDGEAVTVPESESETNAVPGDEPQLEVDPVADVADPNVDEPIGESADDESAESDGDVVNAEAEESD